MVNQQKKPQHCTHILTRGPNAGCQCTTKTSFVNALGRRLCSKHKAAAPPATHVWAAMTIQDTYRDRRERLRGSPLDLAALPRDALYHILDHGLDPKARRRLAQTCVAHRAAVEPCRVLDLGMVLLAWKARGCSFARTTGFGGVGFEGLWSSEKLVIKDRHLEDCQGVALAEVLRRNTRLVCLELDGCTHTSSFMTHLAGALVTNTSLRDLRIRECGLRDAKAMILCKGLESNTGLMTVDLSKNFISCLDETALETALKVNQTLESIRLERHFWII